MPKLTRLVAAAALAWLLTTSLALAASARSENFIVTAATPELAREVAQAAEQFRRDLAIEWLGRELPRWSDICPITVQAGPHLGAGGETSFFFDRQPVGRPHGWKMIVQGSRERILDSVLPHEVSHTIFATHFGRPLPRWADEGACTTVESDVEKSKQDKLLIQFLTTRRGIAFNDMFAMKEYPADILPLYSQGYSLAKFLIQQGGKPKFMQYVGEGLNTNNWTAATQRFYGYRSLSELQTTWVDWVGRGSPPLQQQLPAEAIAATQGPLTVRGQEETAGEPMQQELVPVPQQFAANGPAADDSGASYYERQRELAASGRIGHEGEAATPTANIAATRPQEPQRAGQVVLEWERPPGSPYQAAPATGGPAPLIPASGVNEVPADNAGYERPVPPHPGDYSYLPGSTRLR